MGGGVPLAKIGGRDDTCSGVPLWERERMGAHFVTMEMQGQAMGGGGGGGASLHSSHATRVGIQYFCLPA